MTNKVGPKGQVVIPKEFRDELGIRPGDEVVFWLEGGELRLKRLMPTSLRGRFKGDPDWKKERAADKRFEWEKDERRLRRLSP